MDAEKKARKYLVYKLTQMADAGPLGFDAETIREAARALESAGQGEAQDYPECSGDPKSCPENEGYGCCGGRQPEPQACVAHATASKDAEIEQLRDALEECHALSVERWRRLLAAEAENERLRKALEEIRSRS